MRVLLTGANGFIGKMIVQELLAEEYETVCLLNKNSKSEPATNNKNEIITNAVYADLRDSGAIRNLNISGVFDAVVHCAGLAHQFGKVSAGDFQRVNVEGTRNIAELAVKTGAWNFVLISSVAVYGKSSGKSPNKTPPAVSEEEVCKPSGIYALSKLKSEQIAREICEAERLNLTILRPATVIGEDDRGNVARLIDAIDKKRFFWIGKGENLKSLVYKGDVAKAVIKVLSENAMRENRRTEIFNVTGNALPLKEIVSEISSELGIKNPSVGISEAFPQLILELNRKTFKIKRLENLAETLDKWLADDVFSGEKIRRRYGFEAQTTVTEAIRREVESYQRNLK